MENWFEVYQDLAQLLSDFYKTNGTKTGKELYKLFIDSAEFRERNKWIDKFVPVFKVRSLDPIHIFSSFNSSSLSSSQRIDRIKVILKLFRSERKITDIDFTGCPFPQIIHMVGARDEKAQIDIWNTFYNIHKNKKRALQAEVFKKSRKWYGIDISSFTIFLFWIDSWNFLPLDRNTLGFLLATGKIQEKPRNADQYLRLLSRTNSEIYREITSIAFDVMSKGMVDTKMIFTAELRQYLGDKGLSDPTLDFKIVAIRPLHGTEQKYLKILKEDTTYRFYSAFEFKSDDTVECHPSKDTRLYNINGLNVNISALVGKNGSGKSTLTELLFISLNNIAYSLLSNKSQITEVIGVNVELFIRTTTLIKIRINNGNVNFYEYTLSGLVYASPKPVRPKFNLNQFFYTVAINYSHYSLNSKHLEWVQPLFHKNDAYQTPLVINPMRIDGNIDVNTEDYLVKTRLLANILEPISGDDSLYNLRNIADVRSAQTIFLKLNPLKVKYVYDKIGFWIFRKDQEKLLRDIYEIFEIPDQKGRLVKYANKYILKKIVRISITYSHYQGYFNTQRKRFVISRFREYLELLKRDQSHITFKLKQAINFIKYGHIGLSASEVKVSVEDLSAVIEREVIATFGRQNLKTIDLLPPSFFSVEIELSDGSDFKDLSSGEKQKIYTISSLVYHLRNITSVSSKDLINYNYVNVLFDEVELYYHPEMQRTFIDYLLRYLSRANLSFQGINFCFVTHSPLMLSDIPNHNILFLKGDGLFVEDTETISTFGANIHDLLAESFFLENGLIGEFARSLIQDVIDNLQEIPVQNMKILAKEEIVSIVKLIGEPFLREKLIDMYCAKYGDTEGRELSSYSVKL